MPICTLPILNGKMYMITSPELISASLKARTMSFEPILFSQLQKLCPVSDSAMKTFMSHEFSARWNKIIWSKMAGLDLLRLNVEVLNSIFKQLDELPHDTAIPDAYIWFRDLLSTATISALLGSKNPFLADPTLIEDYW
jgi:hypothetical protein